MPFHITRDWEQGSRSTSSTYLDHRWQNVSTSSSVNLKSHTGKNNGFPFLDILGLGYLKNTHKNPKIGRVRQMPIREFGWEYPDWDCLTLPNLGFLWVFMGIRYFFLCHGFLLNKPLSKHSFVGAEIGCGNL